MCVRVCVCYLWDSNPATRLQEILNVPSTFGHGEFRLQDKEEQSYNDDNNDNDDNADNNDDDDNDAYSPQRGRGRGCWGRIVVSRDWQGDRAPPRLSGRLPGRWAETPSDGPRCSGQTGRWGQTDRLTAVVDVGVHARRY